jgi:hypothetical protein
MTMKKPFVLTILILCAAVGIALAALVVPTDIEQPGTQPGEVTDLESPGKCDNCHGGSDQAVEPAFNWRGSMMANAGRDPIFWATLAIAEQDFVYGSPPDSGGAGDLCIRCHSTAGWLSGRSTPTDGSGLAVGDADGVECDFCHKMTNPDNSELPGVMNPPYIANDEKTPATGYYGSGMASIWPGAEKLGPYNDANARHRFRQSTFHRSKDFCGTCHDVSNPAVGDLAHNQGTQPGADSVTFDGILGSLVDGKAAFNNFPYMYGIVERTYSEYFSGALSGMPVSDYPTLLPSELQAGALKAAYDSAMAAQNNPNAPDYVDGALRTFTCQTCHLRPVTGYGANKQGVPLRLDLALHDMTGGNYWMPDVIKYLDAQGKLLLGGGLTQVQLDAMAAGKARAMKQLSEAASLAVTGDTLRVVNLTAHKLISGYPEGRRMWLNIKWYDNVNPAPIREDGAYGSVATIVNPFDSMMYTVNSIMDPASTKVYEVHPAMTQEWADQLLGLGYPDDLALSFDRVTGNVYRTLGELAGGSLGPYYKTFHFALNNHVKYDNRIPPFGMTYDEARKRNALPVPDDQYGGVNGNPPVTYNYFDNITLNPPVGAAYATIDLLYQPTSWEYIQFLWKANTGDNTFLADEGINLLDAWLKTGQATPFVMASTTWGTAPTPGTPEMAATSLTTWSVDKRGNFVAQSTTFKSADTVGIEAIVQDENQAPLPGVQVFMKIGGGTTVVNLQGFTDATGVARLEWKTARWQAAGEYTATVIDLIKSGYTYNPALGVESVVFTIQ